MNAAVYMARHALRQERALLAGVGAEPDPGLESQTASWGLIVAMGALACGAYWLATRKSEAALEQHVEVGHNPRVLMAQIDPAHRKYHAPDQARLAHVEYSQRLAYERTLPSWKWGDNPGPAMGVSDEQYAAVLADEAAMRDRPTPVPEYDPWDE